MSRNPSRIVGLDAGMTEASSIKSVAAVGRRLKTVLVGFADLGSSKNASSNGEIATRLHAAAPRVDYSLGAAGVAAAIGSAAFAGYMVIHSDSGASASAPAPLVHTANDADQSAAPSADYGATGSIRYGGAAAGGAAARGDQRDVFEQGAKPAARRNIILQGYVLRLVRNGFAIVRGRDGDYAVAPGLVLPEAGRVLSIQRRGNRWIVVTSNGVIAEPSF